MSLFVSKREPDLFLNVPVWFHIRGCKMTFRDMDLKTKSFTINSNAADLKIAQIESADSGLWRVSWHVQRSQSERVMGNVVFNKEDLKAAFGLSETSGVYGDRYLQIYGGDVAEQGKYIRWNTFLNIPCPGTGHDGDPNISIEIDDQMQNAVRQLLGN